MGGGGRNGKCTGDEGLRGASVRSPHPPAPSPTAPTAPSRNPPKTAQPPKHRPPTPTPQRVWASENPSTLRWGALIGFALTTALIFVNGFGGWLALAGGLVTEKTNPNLYFFQLLGRSGKVRNWVGVAVVLLALTMNEGAVDSLQNGVAAALGGHFFKHAPLWWNRWAPAARGGLVLRGGFGVCAGVSRGVRCGLGFTVRLWGGTIAHASAKPANPKHPNV